MDLFNFWMYLPVHQHCVTNRVRHARDEKCVSMPTFQLLGGYLLRVVTDLEVSKPQGKSRENNTNSRQSASRRSRTPEHRPMSPRSGSARGSSIPRGGSHYNNDRSYRPGPRDGRDHRDRDRERERDDYDRRSPPARYPRGRDDYRPQRDRTRSPPARYRSRTPEDIPLPRRAPEKVPEVQVIVTDELDR